MWSEVSEGGFLCVGVLSKESFQSAIELPQQRHSPWADATSRHERLTGRGSMASTAMSPPTVSTVRVSDVQFSVSRLMWRKT